MLPLTGPKNELGVLVNTGGPKQFSTVYLGVNIFMPEDLKTAEKKVFDTVEEMLAAGWEVD
jgi:hypothetical protein